jgi:hypothetical protein
MSPKRLALAFVLAVPGAFIGALAALLAFSVGITPNLTVVLPASCILGAVSGFLTGLLLGSSPTGIAPPRWQTLLVIFSAVGLPVLLFGGIKYHQNELIFDGLSGALVVAFLLVVNKSIRLASFICFLAAALSVVAWLTTADLFRLADAVLWATGACVIYLLGDRMADHLRAILSKQ